MIRLDRLRLHNFRCFEDCEVEFEPELTVIVARNGQGKTAILDAVALALGLFVDTIAGMSQWRGFRKRDVRRIREGEDTITPPGLVEFEADAVIEGRHISWRRWMRNEAKREITSKSDSRTLLEASQSIHDRLHADDGLQSVTLPLIAYYGTGRSWNDSATKSRRSKQLPANERCLGYVGCLNSAASYNLLVDWYETTFASLRGHTPVIGMMKGNRPEFLLAAVNGAVETVLEPETGWKGLRWDLDDRQLILEHLDHGQLPLDFLSDGVRNTAALVADVAHRCARLNPHLENAAEATSGILLVDEVDLHLHPEWQQLIIEMLCTAFPRLQIVVSTHSPQVLSTVNSNAIRVINIDDGAGKVFKPDFQTQGVESADVLAKVMDVNPVPQIQQALWLSEYRTLLHRGEEGSKAATVLWAQLLDHFGRDHSAMSELNTIRRLVEFKKENNIPLQ